MRLQNKGIVFSSRIKVYDKILFGVMKHYEIPFNREES